MLNGYNTRCLPHITLKSAHEEASARTRTYDLVMEVRRRRHKWLDHILRLPGHRCIKETVCAQMEMNLSGNITMDSPDLEDMTALNLDREAWRNSFMDSTAKPRCTKVTVSIHRTTKTDEERNLLKTVWTSTFNPADKQVKKKHSQKQRLNNPHRTKEWTDRQRAEWARAYSTSLM